MRRAMPGPVLVIEDNILVAGVIRDMLEELGCEVLHAVRAEEGLALVKARAVALVLSDIELAGAADGLVLARSLGLSEPDIPVLLMTGNPAKAQDAQGEFTVLPKPFGVRQLADAIDMAASKG